MKRLLLSIFLITTFGIWNQLLIGQICDPDTTVGNGIGAHPDTLIDGFVGSPYSATITFVLPTDTVIIPGFPAAQFCSFVLAATTPKLDTMGLMVECSEPDCIFPIDHKAGADNRFCAVISGNLTAPPMDYNDSLIVSVTANIGTYNATLDTCISPSGLTIDFFAFPFSITDTSSTAIEDLTRDNLRLRLYPNPTSGSATVSFQMAEMADVEINMLDATGRIVASTGQRNAMGNQIFAFDNSGLASGLYLVSISFNEGEKVFTEKLLVR